MCHSEDHHIVILNYDRDVSTAECTTLFTKADERPTKKQEAIKQGVSPDIKGNMKKKSLTFYTFILYTCICKQSLSYYSRKKTHAFKFRLIRG